MKGNKCEDKLTIKKGAHPGIDFFFSPHHIIAAWRISSTTTLHQLTLGKSETSIVMKASFPLALLSMEGNNKLLNATTKNIGRLGFEFSEFDGLEIIWNIGKAYCWA
jgi:hypothetical protein